MMASAQEPTSITVEKESKFQFEKTIEEIKMSVKDAGWSIPHEHNMQASMEKAGKTVKPSKIIVLCNADFAYQVLSDDQTKHYSSMMPCRVSVYEKQDGKTYLAWVNLEALVDKADGKASNLMKKVQNEIEEILMGVIED